MNAIARLINLMINVIRLSASAYGAGLSGFLLLRDAKVLRDKTMPPVALVNSFLHLLLMPALPLLGLAALRRNLLRVALFALPAWNFARSYGPTLLRGARLPATALHPGHGNTFTLLSFNMHGEDDCLAPMIDVIREANADIVALQEVGPAAARALERAFSSLYPHRALHPNPYRSAGQAVLSRFPIAEDRYWRYEHVPRALGHQRTVFDMAARGEDRLTLYNIHPVHPGMVERLFDPAPRAVEIQKLLRMMAGERDALLICGDMNMSDQSDDYRAITAVYRDAFCEAGRGMGYTFPDWRAAHARTVILSSRLHFLPLFLRLDYIFHNERLQAIAVEPLVQAAGSDHRPLYARLEFMQKPL